MGERPNPDTPHPSKRRPPRAPSCRPHSAPSQLARTRAVGLVTGRHTHTPRIHSPWVAGPGRTPQGRAVWLGRATNSGRPSPRQEAPPTGALVLPPQRAKPARKDTRFGVGDGSPDPHLPHPQPVGSGTRPHAPGRAVRGGRAPNPGRPMFRQEAPPPGALVQPPTARIASSQERALWGRRRVTTPTAPAPTASG